MDKKSKAFVSVILEMVTRTRMDEIFWPWFVRMIGDLDSDAPVEAKEIMRRVEAIYELRYLAPPVEELDSQ